MESNEILNIFVLLAVGAIIAALINQATAVQGGFTKFNSVWKWAIGNAYGIDPTNDPQHKVAAAPNQQGN